MDSKRLYYSIAEVSDMLKISQSNLRFWEKEFRQLKPRRNNRGTRFYTKEDIQVVKQIIFLTKDQKLTLDGAKKKLGSKRDEVEVKQQVVERLTKLPEAALQNPGFLFKSLK